MGERSARQPVLGRLRASSGTREPRARAKVGAVHLAARAACASPSARAHLAGSIKDPRAKNEQRETEREDAARGEREQRRGNNCSPLARAAVYTKEARGKERRRGGE